MTDESTQTETPADTSPNETRWVELVEKIRRDDAGALEELYRVFGRGIRYYLCRQLGPQDLEDRIHDTFLIVTQAIRRGELRDPARLMGYVRTVVRRQVAAQIEQNIAARRQQSDLDTGLHVSDPNRDPEDSAMEKQYREIARRALESVSSRDREILVRFYLEEQTPDQICREMRLTDTQFRLLKSRAKARFGQMGRKAMAHRKWPRICRDGGDARRTTMLESL